MIQTLIFDLGGVIVPLDYRAARAAIQRVSSLSPESIEERIASSGLVEPFETGKLSAEEFYQALSAHLGLKVSYEEFVLLWSALFPAQTLIPEAFLEGLHRRYKLILLSNTNPIHFSYIQRNYPILRHFDAYVLSYQVGVLKPERAMYEAALAAAGCQPEECFYTDDDPRNVEAALRFGFDAELFQGFEQLRQALVRRSIAVDHLSES